MRIEQNAGRKTMTNNKQNQRVVIKPSAVAGALTGLALICGASSLGVKGMKDLEDVTEARTVNTYQKNIFDTVSDAAHSFVVRDYGHIDYQLDRTTFGFDSTPLFNQRLAHEDAQVSIGMYHNGRQLVKEYWAPLTGAAGLGLGLAAASALIGYAASRKEKK